MRNRYLEKFDSIIKIKIEGKNINNYIKRLIKNKINIIKLIPISYKEVHLIVKYSEYKKISKYKSIYKISIINNYGTLRIKNTIKKNTILLVTFFISIMIMIGLSNLIFTIDIIHEDNSVRTLIRDELARNGIRKFTFKKKYNELERIENKILLDNKDRLEWIEIIETGTKYTVRVEERLLTKENKSFKYQDIVAKKDAIITKINASSGEKVKEVNDYVTKGMPIISGSITMPDNTTRLTKAVGSVYGEVWYQVTLDYPFVYKEEKITGKTKNIYVLNFLNKRISFFDFAKYKSFKSKNKIIFKSTLANINFSKEHQYELIVKDEVYPEDIATNKAIDYLKQKLLKDNKEVKKIKKVTVLSSSVDDSMIHLNLFVTAIENIGEVSIIQENPEDINSSESQNSNATKNQ